MAWRWSGLLAVALCLVASCGRPAGRGGQALIGVWRLDPDATLTRAREGPLGEDTRFIEGGWLEDYFGDWYLDLRPNGTASLHPATNAGLLTLAPPPPWPRDSDGAYLGTWRMADTAGSRLEFRFEGARGDAAFVTFEVEASHLVLALAAVAQKYMPDEDEPIPDFVLSRETTREPESGDE